MNADSAEPGNTPTASALSAYLSGALPRALALFLGGFSLLNVIGALKAAHFNANLWWIDFRAFQPWVANGLLCLASLFLLSYAIAPVMHRWRRIACLVFISLLLLESITNAVMFYDLLNKRSITAAIPVPFSIFISGALSLILVTCLRSSVARPNWPVIAMTTFAVAIIFPVLQMFCFGKTDYRRKADVAVVFGARVFANGQPSDALADRVRTGVQLYRDGLVSKLLFSGGPGDGRVHETEAMKALALRMGVPEQDILTDAKGVNTRATVQNTEKIFSALHASRVLVVSHFYHLPRIKMSYQRTGWDVYTVPARESYTLRLMPYFMAREVAALWVYYLRPLAGGRATQQGIG
jgi:vancomycin permeability regulator SanA